MPDDRTAVAVFPSTTPSTIEDVECPLSQRVDGKKHSWRWNGDNPEIVCVYCGEWRDALTDRVYRPGQRGNEGEVQP